MKDSLTENLPVVISSEAGILIFFPALLPATDLLPVLFPYGKPADIVRALGLLPGRKFLFSDAVRALPPGGNRLGDLCRILTEQLDFCDRILTTDGKTDFRLHCAVTARFCGCRTNIRELPPGALPIPLSARARWTAFLLCLFLSYWVDAPCGSSIRIEEVRQETLGLRTVQNYDRIPPERLPFLSLPCFRDFEVTVSDGRMEWKVTLPRERTLLRASSGAILLTVLLRVEE